jgi:phosphatidylserine decarboxylase
LQQEELNFVLTNRVPRRFATRLIGWFSKLEQPLVRDVSIGIWRLFSGLDLRDAKKTRFTSMHDCFIRKLKEGARPIDEDPSVLVSPCDGIVGASGSIIGTELMQVKGFPYSLSDLLDDSDLVSLYCNGRYVTLRAAAWAFMEELSPIDVKRLKLVIEQASGGKCQS